GPGLEQFFADTATSETDATLLLEWLTAGIRTTRRKASGDGLADDTGRLRERGDVAEAAARLAFDIREELARDREAIAALAEQTDRPIDSAEAANLLAMIDYLDRGSALGVLDALIAVEVYQFALRDRVDAREDVMVE